MLPITILNPPDLKLFIDTSEIFLKFDEPATEMNTSPVRVFTIALLPYPNISMLLHPAHKNP